MSRAQAARNVPDEEFERLVESEDPPTVTALAELGRKKRPVAPRQTDIHGRDPEDFKLPQTYERAKMAIMKCAEIDECNWGRVRYSAEDSVDLLSDDSPARGAYPPWQE